MSQKLLESKQILLFNKCKAGKLNQKYSQNLNEHKKNMKHLHKNIIFYLYIL